MTASVAASDMPYREKLAAYARIGHHEMQTDAFKQFCSEHLSHLDDAARDFFTTDIARQAVRSKVASLFPEQEVDEFTDLFWNRIQNWREDAAQASRV